jgi:LemA protein
MMFSMKTRPNFAVENEKEISKAPQVDFGAAPKAPAPGQKG